MEETFKISKKGFISIIISLIIAALILRIRLSGFDSQALFLEELFTDKLFMRFGVYAMLGLGFFAVLFMPFSAFLVYWCSMVAALYYLFSSPLEATVLIFFLLIIPLLNRFQVLKIPDVSAELPGMGLIAVIMGTIFLILDFMLHKHLFVKFIFLLPTLHVLSMRPGDDSQNRFQGEIEQVTTNLSSTQKAKMTRIDANNWWEFIRPHIEPVAINICVFFDRFSDIKFKPPTVRETPHLHTRAQDKARNTNLGNLKKRDPNFQETQFLQRAKRAFNKVMDSFYKHKIEKIQSFVSDALYEQFKCHVDEQIASGIKYHYDSLASAKFSIDHVYSDNSFDEIQVLIQASINESVMDLKTGKTIGLPKVRKFYEYWSFIRRPSVKTLQKPGLLEGSCPNCGSPLLIGQATVCKACGSFIRSGFYDWVLAKITQGCEWSYSDPALIPSWKELKRTDPDFTVHQIEDLGGVLFWNLRLAERTKTLEAIFRFSSKELIESLTLAINAKSSKGHTYWENTAIASVCLKGILVGEQLTALYVLVVWSGIPVNIDGNGKVSERIRYSKPVRDVLVLSRDSKHKTNQNNTLSSSHCRNCGGALKSSFANHCGFCGSILTDGKEWQLAKLLKEDDAEYSEILTRKSKIVSARIAENMAEELEKAAEETKVIETRSGRDIISVMAQVLISDNVIDDAEMKFIKEMAIRYHMPDESLEGLLESVKEGKTFIPKPQNQHEAQEIIQGAIRMAYADGVLAEEEEKALGDVAKQLGYTAFDLKRFMRNHEKVRHQEKIARELEKRKQQ